MHCRRTARRVAPRQAILAAFALAALLALLGGVAIGYFYAVEAAAMGAFTLLCAGLIGGQLRGAALRELLHDAIAITGALFSLLIAATTFTLILRLLGTDRLVDNLVAGIPGGDVLATAAILAVIGLCAFVLDAFEIIFVIVPIVIPPLLVRVADARWVAVLVLLTLQSSFLLPPFGYALMMVRGAAKNPGAVSPVRARAGAVPGGAVAAADRRAAGPQARPFRRERRREHARHGRARLQRGNRAPHARDARAAARNRAQMRPA